MTDDFGEKAQPLLLDRCGVEARYGISKRYLEIAAVRGDGPPYFKIGRAVRYCAADIDTWLQAQRVGQPHKSIA